MVRRLGFFVQLYFGIPLNWNLPPPPPPSGDSDRLVCLEDGLWSFPEAYCKIECPEVPNISNAKLLTASCLASGHDVGSVCRYKCNPGFYVMGSLKRKTPRWVFWDCGHLSGERIQLLIQKYMYAEIVHGRANKRWRFSWLTLTFFLCTRAQKNCKNNGLYSHGEGCVMPL